jgi:hypothetical protein
MATYDLTCAPHSSGRAGTLFDPGKWGLRRFFAVLTPLLFLTLLLAAGCATVKPYEREYLSRPSMDLEREAAEAKFYSHVLDAREGATGGIGTAGGGCGCN